jgi:hypothetical protein
MKLTPIFTSLLLSLSLAACADDPGIDTDTYPGEINQQSEVDLSGATACGIDTPCSDGLDCLWIDAAGLDTAICISAEDACDAISCGDGECLILESYPGQVACSGGGDSGDGDTPVCNTPDGSCDDGGGTSEPDCTENCTEPGNPGDSGA